MNCAEVAELLPAQARGEQPSLGVRRHLSTCAGCRAELARYEAILQGAAQLPRLVAAPPPGLKEQLFAIPTRTTKVESLRTHVSRNRSAYVGGLAVALAGAAGAALWRARRGPATA